MRRSKPEQIGLLVNAFLRAYALEPQLQQQRIIDSWATLLPGLAKYTTRVYIRNQTLYVNLNSAVMRQELSLKKQWIVQTLNGKAGATVITQVVLQ